VADPQGRGTEDVRQLEPDGIAADAGEDDLADRLVIEAGDPVPSQVA
jgi:hypothetical protein